ncbi:MAG: pyridoxal phosphate-dependent aminotransferase [Polyangiaceae bacterium]
MYGPTHYLDWARRFYGTVRFDLASSGIPVVPPAELGAPDPASARDVGGWTRLREAIAGYHAVSTGEVVVALGTTHGLWLAYAALTSPGDDVVVESPGYEPLVRIPEGMGVRVIPFERSEAEGWSLDPDRIARAMTPRTRAVVVTNLHNPSGVRTPDDVLRSLARRIEGRGAHLLVDEVYAPFDGLVDGAGVFGGSAHRLAPGVVAVGSLTKCYGVANQRVGWLLGPAPIVARAQHAITASCGMLPLDHAHVGVHAFGRLPYLAARARAILPGKRDLVARWVVSHGLAWHAPAQGLYGLVRVPGAGDLTPVIEAAAREREVLVAAGSFFGVPDGFRVAWSSPPGELDEGLGRLADALATVRR